MAPTAEAFAKRRRLTAQFIIYGRSDILWRFVESAPKLNGSNSFNPAREEEPEEKQPESTPGMERDMSKGSPIKLILFFTLPLLAGNIFQQFYSMVDTFVVGRFVGVDALAALGTTSAMAFLVLGFVGGLTAGFSVIISQRFGAGDPDGMRSATAMSIITAFGLTIILSVVSMATSMPLLRLLRTPANIIEDANIYISILFAGIMTTVY
jgi:Na+-driven multidrug efflux pump